MNYLKSHNKSDTINIKIKFVNIFNFPEYINGDNLYVLKEGFWHLSNIIKEKIKIDDWCSDTVYTKFLCEYLRVENHLDAIARSVETTVTLGTEFNIKNSDVLRYGNANKICYLITTGKISPWMMYHSNSGIEFLNKITPDQERLIMDYINPELWTIKFKKSPEQVAEVKEVLRLAGY